MYIDLGTVKDITIIAHQKSFTKGVVGGLATTHTDSQCLAGRNGRLDISVRLIVSPAVRPGFFVWNSRHVAIFPFCDDSAEVVTL